MNDNNEKGFVYTYSAREQTELRRIRDKYTKREESALERVRRLDRRVTQKAQVISLILGVVGALIFGFGMSLFMSSLPSAMGLGRVGAVILGILSALAGGALAGLAYPAYNRTVSRERDKVAPEIIRLTDELLK